MHTYFLYLELKDMEAWVTTPSLYQKGLQRIE